MVNQVAEPEFNLTAPDVARGQHGGSRPGAGRPRARRDAISEESWQRAMDQWPTIFEGLIKHAMRCNELQPPKTAIAVAQWIGTRLWPEPVAPPIQVDINAVGGILEAIAAGELTPTNGAALLRARSVGGLLPAAVADPAAAQTARTLLADRLARVIEARQPTASADRAEAGPPATRELDIDAEEIEAIVKQAVEEALAGEGMDDEEE